MHDDEVNAVLQALKDAGVPPALVRRALDLLGRAQVLIGELAATVVPSERNRVQETMSRAIFKILRDG